MSTFVQKYSLYFSWVITCCAVLASLYFSMVLRLEPCHLCWYQRISLFPSAILLGIAAYRGDYKIVPYVIPILAFGLLVSVYQILLQEIPGWNPIDMCGHGPSCSEKHLIGFGPITIPMLSSINFIFLITFLTVIAVANKRKLQYTNEL